jgi:1,4-dihydroxy-2-naphthoate octaprenyltransferase
VDLKRILKVLLSGMRPRTLILSFSPVLFAFLCVGVFSTYNALVGILCALTAVSLQVFSNFANDYADKGSDNTEINPVRARRFSETVSRKSLLIISLSFAGIAAIFGILTILITKNFALLSIGALSLLAAWFYSATKFAYGRFALGDLFVFVFFGPIACSGTEYALSGSVGALSLLLGSMHGILTASILMLDNIRDITRDAENGKITLANLFGAQISEKLLIAEYIIPIAVSTPVLLLYFQNTTPLILLVTIIWLIRVINLVKRARENKAPFSSLFNASLGYATIWCCALSLVLFLAA